MGNMYFIYTYPSYYCTIGNCYLKKKLNILSLKKKGQSPTSDLQNKKEYLRVGPVHFFKITE